MTNSPVNNGHIFRIPRLFELVKKFFRPRQMDIARLLEMGDVCFVLVDYFLQQRQAHQQPRQLRPLPQQGTTFGSKYISNCF